MGELQHGTYYDDCEDLTKEEINIVYNFYENGELHSDDEDPNQSDNEEDSLYSEDHSTTSTDVNEPEDMAISNHEFSTAAVCYVHLDYLT